MGEEKLSDNQSQSVASDATDFKDGLNHHIVGIGASAGGLDALERLFSKMPVDTGASFVVVQHLSPDFKSHMDKLLSRVTDMPLHVINDGETVEPDTIYLIPPKKEMVISNGRLLLTDRSQEKILSHPIDQFLRSLAQDAGRKSIGIILSGTGSDGSRGVVDVQENGGLVIVQDPTTCSFDSMPVNARDTGSVHMVLKPEDIGEALDRYVRDGKISSQTDIAEMESLEEGGLNRIFVLLQRAHKIDFSLYKSGTVGRRVQRRIEVTSSDNLDQYVDLLNDDNDEVEELYKDLLIGVTKFFRDADAFKLLETEIIPDLVANADGNVIRVWVCACASGEEAYSLAILFSEAIERAKKVVEFKIFATDAHRTSLQFAAAGFYPESSMKEVSKQRREKFFVERSDGFMVNATLRKSIVFAPHNVISDPPFTQMNMVTCRNMLIYFRPAAQRKTLSLFHFALKINGVLFLGPSESTGEIGDEFDAVDKHWKIYRKRRDVRLPLDMRMPLQSTGLIIPQANRHGQDSFTTTPRDMMPALYDQLLSQFMPPSIVVDERFEILHVFEGAEVFLRVVHGRPSTNLLDQIHISMKSTLAGALRHAQRDNAQVRYTGVEHPSPQEDCLVEMIISPVMVEATKMPCLLVQFDTIDSIAKPSAKTAAENLVSVSSVNVSDLTQDRINALERDLDYSRQNLQATIEELETSNEELQATNEEMVAANEELQSTNEELHSVNEELYTVNAEHQRRVAELDEANADMNNLLASTRVGVVFLDNEFYIRRFTPAIGRMFYMEGHDIGRSIEGFVERVSDETFMTRLSEVLEQRVEREWEVVIEGESYLVRAMPYWTEGGILGVVVALVNVQPLKKAQAQLERFKFMCDVSYDGQVLTDANAKIVYCNEIFGRRLGYSQEEMKDLSVMQFDADHQIDSYRQRFEKAKSQDGLIFESTYFRKDGSTYPVEVSLTHVVLGGESFLYSQVRDITERLAADDQRRLLESAVSSVSNGIVISDAQKEDHPITFVNDGFLAMTGYELDEVLGRNCRFLQSEDTSEESVSIIRDGLAKGESTKALLLNKKKDDKPFWNDLYITPVKDAKGTVTHFVGVQNDITDRIQAGEAAQSSEKTIRMLLNSTAEGIYGLDKHGNCTFCNQSAATMLGYDHPDELITRSMHRLCQHTRSDGSSYPKEASPIFQCLEDGEKVSSNGEVFWKKDGTSFPVQFWSHAIVDDERVVGAVVTFVDDSDRLSIEKELRDAKDQADIANKAKSRFLANISHELRTPMAAILGFTEILQQEVGDVEVNERLDAIRRNGDYLLRLLNDVLDLSRIEAGKLRLTRTEVDLPELLADIDELMQIRTIEYNNELVFTALGKIPQTITTDEARLRQVLINLVANALKFSPGGCVKVGVDLSEDSRLRFTVEDNGIGMDANQQRELFQPFTQATNAITERFGGSGLGLSITQRLVEALDGEIIVQSVLGEGSTFTVILPVSPVGELIIWSLGEQPDAVPSDLDEMELEDLQSDSMALNARILVVDDMRDVRSIAEHFLTKAGCTVQIAENGQQAVEEVEQAIAAGNPFELILMDMQMPILSGEEALAELRTRGVDVPVIALTADAMKGTRQRLIGLGFDGYMSKPIHAGRLVSLASKLLKRDQR